MIRWGVRYPNPFLPGPSLPQLMGRKFPKGGFGASHHPSGYLPKLLSKKYALLRVTYKRGEPGVKRKVSLLSVQGGRPGSPNVQVSSSQLVTVQPAGNQAAPNPNGEVRPVIMDRARSGISQHPSWGFLGPHVGRRALRHPQSTQLVFSRHLTLRQMGSPVAPRSQAGPRLPCATG